MNKTQHISYLDAREMFGKKKHRHKYGAERCEVDGITFDSKGEARRYAELKIRERAGEIFDLKLQVAYPLEVRGVRIGTYYADFVYCDVAGGKVVEDFKGIPTPVYRLKKKLMFAIYGIEIFETGRK